MRKCRLLNLLCIVFVCAVTAGCASSPRWDLDTPQVTADDMRGLPSDPKERDPSLYWDAVHQSSFYLIKQSLDLPRQYRKLTGRMHEAVNADVFGNVPNSSWFTNRHGHTRLSREELQRGPNQIDGPDMSGPWVITRAKTEGVTPGFFIKDAKGETFVIKFDPTMHPELATGAEMVSTKLFHAFGYHVPENYLVTFDPAKLTIKEGLEYKDSHGARHAFTPELLEEVLTKVALRTDGRIRAIASRLLPGTPVGPFSYKGRRKDDPNDLIPHEHRRELRGLKIFAQLANHFDTKDHNTLDVMVEEDGRRFIKHYLIDFGSTLGSDGDEPKSGYKGYAYVLDLEQAMVSLFTLGLRRWSWEHADPEGIPRAIGYFEADHFDPPGWKPLHGNPAFDNMTNADAAWACEILADFTRDELLACVESAEYSDPEATRYLAEALWIRREKILTYYSEKICLLSDFTISDDGEAVSLSFEDILARESASTESLEYIVGLEHGDQSLIDEAVIQTPVLKLTNDVRIRMSAAVQSAATDSDRILEFDVTPRRADRTIPSVTAYIYFDGDPAHTRVVGIEYDN